MSDSDRDPYDLGAALEEAIANKERIWPTIKLGYCPGCKGSGYVDEFHALGGGVTGRRPCDECDGTGLDPLEGIHDD